MFSATKDPPPTPGVAVSPDVTPGHALEWARPTSNSGVWRIRAQSTVPPFSVHSAALTFSQPLPLHSFWPAQECAPGTPHWPWPLHSLMPRHLTSPAAAASPPASGGLAAVAGSELSPPLLQAAMNRAAAVKAKEAARVVGFDVLVESESSIGFSFNPQRDGS